MTAVDLGPVRYEPPLTYSAPLTHLPQPTVLWTGPRWLRGASRWHRIRDGLQMHWPHDRIVYGSWCGQMIYPKGRGAADDVPTDGLPLCGTCEGRAAGAGHPSPLGDDVPLIFSPDRLTPPRLCPGGKYHRLHEQIAYRVIRCGACGEIVPERNAHRWYDTAGMPRQHKPGPGLVPGCPQHAWRHLVRTPEGVACQCAGLEAS